MSWFAASPASNVEQLIKEATDESIPNGELDLVKSLEFTDLIRSKKVQPKDAMRGLKKRLSSTRNPNTLLSTLELVDTSIKNGGNHFIVEIASREFLDTFNSKLIQDEDVSYLVRNKALKLIQEWAKVFSTRAEFKYFDKVYTSLKNSGYEFPELSYEITQNFFDSNVPPEWEDSDACMICSNPFSLLNRKHHCRNCGGVYCGEHSGKFIELVDLGISEPVRVCDTCYDEIKNKRKSSKKKKKKDVMQARLAYDSDDDEDLKKALELSLRESQGYAEAPTSYQNQQAQPLPQAQTTEDDEDEEFKAAIAASLRDLEASKQQTNQQSSEPAPSDAYSNLLPQSSTTYQSQPLPPAPTAEHQTSQAQSQYINRLTAQEENSIRQFNTKVVESQHSNIDTQQLTDAYKAAIPLQPKLVNELNEAYYKYGAFVDLNSKIDNIMRLYNRILDERIEGEAFGYNRQPQQVPVASQPQYGYYPSNGLHQSPVHQTPQPLSAQPTYKSQSQLPQLPSYQTQDTSPTQHYVQPLQHQYTSQSQPSYTEEQAPQPTGASEGYEYPPREEDPFKDAENDELEGEEEFSAPPAQAYESVQQHQQEKQEPISVKPDHIPVVPSVNQVPLNKVTDFNFPSVPIKKFDSPEQLQQPQIVQETPKEELLIEL